MNDKKRNIVQDAYASEHLAAWMEFMELLKRLEVYRPGVNKFSWHLMPHERVLY